jgi:hypothetical protein
LFAAPLSIAGSLDKPSQDESRSELSAKVDSLNEFDDLFAEVNAVPLTTEEAQAVEGEGFWGGLIGGVVGGIAGAFCLSSVFNTIQSNAINNTLKAIQTATIGGGILGGLAGTAIGTYYGYTLLPF